MGHRALVFLTSNADRKALFETVGRDGTRVVGVFEGLSVTKARNAWESLVAAAHGGNADHVRLARVADLPGGVWAWLYELSRLASLNLRIRSLNEPWLTLGQEQAELAKFLVAAHQTQHRARIKSGLAKAKAEGRRVGRPPAQVDVEALATARETMSLRATAKKFQIGASTAWRLLDRHRRSRETSISGGREP